MRPKTVGILTSGGDAPGMNAAIRSVTLRAAYMGMETLGIRDGYKGLIEGNFVKLTREAVEGIHSTGGTMLRTSRCPEFETEEGMQEAIRQCRKAGLEGLVVIGGDGTFRGALDLTHRGLPCVALPGTIDNDIACSEYTIGFDTAVNTVREVVDKLAATIHAHRRCFLVEVMGRAAGDLALHAGIACGAFAVLVPEVPFEMPQLISEIQRAHEKGTDNFVIMVSEGLTGTKHSDKPTIHQMAAMIEKELGINSRGDIIGYMQRGGIPTARERLIATRMSSHAVDLLTENIGGRVVVMQNSQIVDMDITEALAMKRVFDRELFDIANSLHV